MHFGLLLQSITCCFLGMESGFTHIQRFLWLSDNVGMFYPKNISVPSIDPPANLDASSAYLFNLCKFPWTFRIPKNGMEFFTWFLELVLPLLIVYYQVLLGEPGIAGCNTVAVRSSPRLEIYLRRCGHTKHFYLLIIATYWVLWKSTHDRNTLQASKEVGGCSFMCFRI